MLRLTLLCTLVAFACGLNHLRPPKAIKQIPFNKQDVGEPLYLTPLINAGAIGPAQSAARVTDPLPGVEGENIESYSGFLTVDEAKDSHMYFWFFPAQEVNPDDAPVVIWLQGGPGSSSMFGLLEIHGPISAIFDNDGATIAEVNPYSWARKANMIYIDNPVGAGYSYTSSDNLPTGQESIGVDLYEFLIQWFKLFPQYQGNEFFPFGESYAGKFVPTIAKKIHDENPSADIKINLAGLGIGDGFMSPPETAVYAEYLYQVGLVDEPLRDRLLDQENRIKGYINNGQWYNAWAAWNAEFNTFESAMGCYYPYDITFCDSPPEEDNYEIFMQRPDVRKALHVGDRPFGVQNVYGSMVNDFMRPERETIEFLLDRYKTLIYNGNMDIICNHSGILEMFAAMETWSAIDEYYQTDRDVFYGRDGEVAGYLKSVQNLRMFVMRNAGHMVPRSQPVYGQDMFEQFIAGQM